MGFLALTVAAGGFILIGAWESISATEDSTQISDFSEIDKKTEQDGESSYFSSSYWSNYAMIGVVSFLFIANSLISVFDAIGSNDRVGWSLQLQVFAVASLFLMYSVLGLWISLKKLVSLPDLILDLILLFGFIEEFMMFYLQRKDISGIENRYFDLLLVPILVCLVSTVFELKSTKMGLSYARLGRGVGLVLQGTWFLQMGLSFYTGLITHGCSLHERSRGNYTIKCKGHPEYHRARSIATLQFNCHLALVATLCMIWYSVVGRHNMFRDKSSQYRPIGEEMQQVQSRFTLDSDEDEIEEEERNRVEKMNVDVGVAVNGHGPHE